MHLLNSTINKVETLQDRLLGFREEQFKIQEGLGKEIVGVREVLNAQTLGSGKKLDGATTANVQQTQAVRQGHMSWQQFRRKLEDESKQENLNAN